jgi:hypothetical protein
MPSTPTPNARLDGLRESALSVKPKLDRGAGREILRKTAEKIGTGHGTEGYGPRFEYGRVTAGRAVAAAQC